MTKFYSILSLGLFLLSFNAVAVENSNSNNQFFKALQYADEARFVESMEILERLGSNGHTLAQKNLASWYHFGYEEIAANASKAIFWYEILAEKNDAEAQLSLAKILFEQQQYAESFPWFVKLANNGDEDSQYHLSFLYVHGQGVEQSQEEAIFWLIKSAKQENSQAQFTLSNFYKNGIGTSIDEKQAHTWLKKSADNGLAKAQFKLAEHYYFSEIEHNQSLAIDLIRRASIQNLPEAIIIEEVLKI